MGEELLDFGLVKDQMQGIIKVVGVGGDGKINLSAGLRDFCF